MEEEAVAVSIVEKVTLEPSHAENLDLQLAT